MDLNFSFWLVDRPRDENYIAGYSIGDGKLDEYDFIQFDDPKIVNQAEVSLIFTKDLFQTSNPYNDSCCHQALGSTQLVTINVHMFSIKSTCLPTMLKVTMQG